MAAPAMIALFVAAAIAGAQAIDDEPTIRAMRLKVPIGTKCTEDPSNAVEEEGEQVAETSECGDVLICDNGQCRSCASNQECRALNGPESACLLLDKQGHRICAHKHLLPPDTRDYTAVGLAIILCAISAGGGIGGGGLLLPMLILLLEFTPHDASPLTNACVLGGACANLAFYNCQLHPSGRRPMISFEVALMMEPMTMAGAVVGVILNKIFPGWLITVLLVLVLGITTKRTLAKGLETWKKESAAAAIAAANPESATSLLSTADKKAAVDGTPSPPPQQPTARRPSVQHSPELEAVLADEVHSPRRDVLTLVAALIVCTLISVLRGPNRQQSLLHIHCGSYEYWTTIGLQLLLLLLVSLWTRSTLIGRYERRKACGYPFLPDDVQWTPTSSVLYPLACAVAGLCAGLFGIGGGIVKGPLMLEMGMLPQVASATSAFMIFFTAASATLQFAMLGDLRPVYAVTLFVAGLLGTALGQQIVGAAMRKSGRASIIVLIIASIIGLSTLIMTVTGVLGFLAEVHEGRSQGFRPLCGSTLVDD